MTTLTITVRVVPCDRCNGTGRIDVDDRAHGDKAICPRCDGRGQVVATTERLLVGLVLAWDRFR
jgi:DnaJ-class molecular chaperone